MITKVKSHRRRTSSGKVSVVKSHMKKSLKDKVKYDSKRVGKQGAQSMSEQRKMDEAMAKHRDTGLSRLMIKKNTSGYNKSHNKFGSKQK